MVAPIEVDLESDGLVVTAVEEGLAVWRDIGIAQHRGVQILDLKSRK